MSAVVLVLAAVSSTCAAVLGWLLATLWRGRSVRDRNLLWTAAFWSGPLTGTLTLMSAVAVTYSVAPLPQPSPRIAELTARLASSDIISLIVIIMAAGASIKLVRLLLGLFKVSMIVRLAVDPIPLSFGGNNLPPVFRSDKASVPFLAGLFRPVVIIPSWTWATFSEVQVRMICAHEFAHALRRDHVRIWAEELAVALLWWSPATAIARKSLVGARETSCDAAVLRDANQAERTAYADTVMRVLGQTIPLANPYFSSDRHQVLMRLRSIRSQVNPPNEGRKIALALSVISLAVGLTSCSSTFFIAQSQASLASFGLFTIRLQQIGRAPMRSERMLYKITYERPGSRPDLTQTSSGLPPDKIAPASIVRQADGRWLVTIG